MKLSFSRQIFEKCSTIKFNENPPGAAELFRADEQTVMTQLIVAFRILSNAPKTRFMKDEELYNQPQDYPLVHGINYTSFNILIGIMI